MSAVSGPELRERLIASGVIVPGDLEPCLVCAPAHLTVLRMDERARREVAFEIWETYRRRRPGLVTHAMRNGAPWLRKRLERLGAGGATR